MQGGRLLQRLALAAVLFAGCSSRVHSPYQSGHDPARDQAGCDGGDTKACMRLAAAYDSGAGVPADDEKSRALFERACKLGDYEGCVSLGVQLEARELAIPDGPQRAVALYQSACDHDVPSGCLFMGYAHAGSSGHQAVARDDARALAFFERTCELEGASGCVHAGSAYFEGRLGVAKNPGRAVELYQRACDLGDGTACHTLGNWLSLGSGGVPQDEARGKALIERGCQIIGPREPCVSF